MTILDLIEQQFGSAQADHLGQQVGLAPAQAHSVVKTLLPLQLGSLIDHAQTPAGAQQLLDLAAKAPVGTVHEILSRPGATETLEGMGNTLTPLLLGSQEHRLADQVAAHSTSGAVNLVKGASVNSDQVQRLGRLTMPLLLGLLGQWTKSQNIGAAGLGAAMAALRPRLGSLIPASLGGLLGGLGLGGLAGAAGAALNAATPNLNMPGVNVPNMNVPNLNVPNVNVPSIQTPTIQAPTIQTPTISPTARPAITPLPGVPSLSAAPLAEPARRGAGWLWALPLALLLGLGGCYLSQQNQTASVTGAATGTEPSTSTEPSAAGSTPTEATPPGEVAAGALAILSPATGASVAAGAFDLSGTGKAGDEVEVFEDGTSLGKATIDEGGKWTLGVPSPTSGQHSYEVKSGTLSAVSAVTVGAATAAAGECTKDYTLSLKDGQSVKEPFRFGGVGGGSGYNVTVTRGGRTIGTKQLPLDASCGYSYTSVPGKGDVSYVVREGSGAEGKEVSSLTLKVQ